MTWLGALNFLVLQWFGVRLARCYAERQRFLRATHLSIVGDGYSMGYQTETERVFVGYRLLRWIVPLTGWWSDFRYVSASPLFTRKRFRWVQLITRVRRVHHPRWSFGWAFPLTTWCRFEQMTYKDHDVEPPQVKTRAGHWKRCERDSYHDSTTTGRY